MGDAAEQGIVGSLFLILIYLLSLLLINLKETCRKRQYRIYKMPQLKAFKTLLSSPKDIVITTHHKPDADALGSSLGLAGFLKKWGHRVTVITPSDYPDFLSWMKGNEEVMIFNENGNEAIAAKLVADADVIFCLDFSSLNRINELGELVRKSKAIKVLVDHHLDPEDFADYAFWSTDAAATAELVYELIEDVGGSHLIDKDIAECLYAGIMTDTGSFKHSNTTVNVHKITAKLMEKGADNAKVAKLVYDTNSVERLKFIGFALSERLVILSKYKTAYFAISEEDLIRFKSRTGDTEGLVNYALSIKGIVMAALIIERDGEVKLSFRSIGEFPVNEIAKDFFEGGGHRNAAGGKSNLSLDDTVKKLISILPQYKEQLNITIKTHQEACIK